MNEECFTYAFYLLVHYIKWDYLIYSLQILELEWNFDILIKFTSKYNGNINVKYTM